MSDAEELPNPVPVILGIVVGIVLLVVGVNVTLWWIAQQNMPVVKPKRVGAKKAKREKLSQGMQVLGD
ncbi:hypothetical protein HT031_000919 [Scenedesmus sp. PABB004]|nr:hypothetical protein HT031_000919 [Scenedesmus sp. PABB004]